MTIAAVLLDVGGVFVLPDDGRLAAVARAHGAERVTPEDLARGHYEAIAAMDRAAVETGVTAHWPRYQGALADALGIPASRRKEAVAAFATAFVDLPWTRPVPASIEALPRLAATGVDLAIVSNSNGTVEDQLRTSGICQVGPGAGVPVVVVVDSFVVGIEKPDPGIFHHTLEVLGVSADEAVHVGDTGWADVVGARAAGVRPVHFDPYGLCPVVEDHDHVASIDGVVALVTAANGGVPDETPGTPDRQ